MDIIKYDKYSVIKIIGSGIEGNVYLYEDPKGRKTALKVFKNRYILDTKDIIVPEKTMINKERKIQYLSKQPCLKDDIKLLNIVYEDNKFIGYTSLYEPYISFENYIFKKKKVKLELLKKLRERVIELNKNGIFIGDFNSSNFAIENNKIRLFDIDNYKTHDYDFDLATSFINLFRLRCNNHQEYLDNYCFNLFSVAFYDAIHQSFILQYLQNEGFHKKMNTEKNNALKLQLLNPNNDYKPDFVIDNMKKGLFK